MYKFIFTYKTPAKQVEEIRQKKDPFGPSGCEKTVDFIVYSPNIGGAINRFLIMVGETFEFLGETPVDEPCIYGEEIESGIRNISIYSCKKI